MKEILRFSYALALLASLRVIAADVTTCYDFYATVLHLLGLDHEKLTYYHNGVNRRLTDVHGHVIKPVLA